MNKPSESTFTVCFTIVLFLLLVAILRLIAILPSTRPSKTISRNNDDIAGVPSNNITNIMILLGSGGHTGEMLRILDQWTHLEKYKFHFIVSSGDDTSLLKLKEFKNTNYTISVIHRARNVGHGKLLAIWNTLISFKSCMGLVLSTSPHVFLSNGPGTAIPIAYTLFIMKFLWLAQTKIIYIESLARVNDLSLTGKLILPISDRILVQWSQLAEKYPRCEYKGLLV